MKGSLKIVETSPHSDRRAVDNRVVPVEVTPVPRPIGSVAGFLAMVRAERLIVTIACLVLVIDLGFLLLHVGHIFSTEGMWPVAFLRNPRFDLMEPANFAALFKVFMAALMVFFFLHAFALSRQPIYAAGVAVVVAVAAIGGLALHARAGEAIGALLGLVARYPEMGPHLGEAMAVGVVGSLLFLLLLVCALRSSGWHRGAGIVIVALFVILGFFAGGIDLLHALMFYESVWLVWGLQVLEDAGELGSITALCAVAAVSARRLHHERSVAG